MKWYRNLYLTEGMRGNRRELIEKIEKNAGLWDVYLVTLAANGQDLFDIFSTKMLLQPPLHGHCPMVVAIAKGSGEAQELAAHLAVEAYERNGDFDICRFLAQELDGCTEEERTDQAELEKALHAVSDADSLYFEYPMERLKKRSRFPFKK